MMAVFRVLIPMGKIQKRKFYLKNSVPLDAWKSLEIHLGLLGN
jgi:hypothetical protein